MLRNFFCFTRRQAVGNAGGIIQNPQADFT